MNRKALEDHLKQVCAEREQAADEERQRAEAEAQAQERLRSFWAKYVAINDRVNALIEAAPDDYFKDSSSIIHLFAAPENKDGFTGIGAVVTVGHNRHSFDTAWNTANHEIEFVAYGSPTAENATLDTKSSFDLKSTPLQGMGFNLRQAEVFEEADLFRKQAEFDEDLTALEAIVFATTKETAETASQA